MACSFARKFLIAASAIASYSTISVVAAKEENDCSGKGNCIDDSIAILPVKIGAIASIVVGIIIGVCLPLLGRTFTSVKPDRNTFFVIRAFAAGLFLATAVVQFLPGALKFPTGESSVWRNIPLPGFLAMFTALCTLIVDALATAYSHLKDQEKPTDEGKEPTEDKELGGNGKDSDCHALGQQISPLDSRSRHWVISTVLELAIIAQSAVVGISVGGSESPWMVIRALAAAFTLQQFWEGMNLGGCLLQEGFNNKFPVVSSILGFLAGATTGIGLLSSDSSPTAVIVEKVFIIGSAGVMVYMCLVDLSAAYFSKSETQKKGAIQIWAYMALLLGLGVFFSVIKWT